MILYQQSIRTSKVIRKVARPFSESPFCAWLLLNGAYFESRHFPLPSLTISVAHLTEAIGNILTSLVMARCWAEIRTNHLPDSL